jgi:hypothetical protein
MARLAVRDFGTSLLLPAGSSVSSTLAHDFSTNVSGSYAFWFKVPPTASNAGIYNPGCSRLDVNIEGGLGRLFVWFQDSAAVGHLVSLGPATVADGRWHHVVVSKSATRVTSYVDGVQAGFFDSTLTTGASTPPLVAGYGSGWNIDDLYTWNRGLTLAEVQGLYYQGTVPTSGLQQGLKFNEGAGLSIADASGNNKPGTATSLTSFSADVPMKVRSTISPNLVKNGDFETAPPFTAVQTGNNTYINGTAAGTSTITPFGWRIGYSGTATAQFDSGNAHSGTNDLKLSTTAIASFTEARQTPAYGTLSTDPFGFVLKPSTAYTLTYWIKTNVVSGSATTGAVVAVLSANGDGTNIQTYTGTSVKTTTDWTQYTLNLTTGANDRFGHVECRVYGHQGTGTLIMDAWFDDIVLTPTIPVTRTAITGPYRQPANNLVVNGSFDYAPAFTAATTSSGTWIDGTAAGSSTNDAYRWRYNTFNAATGSASLDTTTTHGGVASLKLTQAVAGVGPIACATSSLNAQVGLNESTTQYLFPVQPSTSYTLTAWVKTALTSANSKGVDIHVAHYNGKVFANFSHLAAFIGDTQDWTMQTLTFTTAATASYVAIQVRIEGETGSAWFDDISLAPTSGITRSTA